MRINAKNVKLATLSKKVQIRIPVNNNAHWEHIQMDLLEMVLIIVFSVTPLCQIVLHVLIHKIVLSVKLSIYFKLI